MHVVWCCNVNLMQAENDGLKTELQATRKRAEETQSELQRRCSSFECQLQSACSECTAVAEEHVTGSLQSMGQRLDRLQVTHTACVRHQSDIHHEFRPQIFSSAQQELQLTLPVCHVQEAVEACKANCEDEIRVVTPTVKGMQKRDCISPQALQVCC